MLLCRLIIHLASQFLLKSLQSVPAATPTRTRAERLEARVTAEQKRRIEQAAALQGRSVTDFVLSSVQEAARRAIEEHQRLELSLRDSQAFVEALLNPPAPNDRLRETVARYRRTMAADFGGRLILAH